MEGKKYVWCDGCKTLHPIEKMTEYGIMVAEYYYYAEYRGSITKKELTDTDYNPRYEPLLYICPEGYEIEADEQKKDIPETYIVNVEENDGKITATIPADLIDADEDVVKTFRDVEEVAEFIRKRRRR